MAAEYSEPDLNGAAEGIVSEPGIEQDEPSGDDVTGSAEEGPAPAEGSGDNGSAATATGSEGGGLYPAGLEDYGEEEEEEEEDQGYPLEFEKFWKLTQENPVDFSAWTSLLQYIEQEGHMSAARKAFDSFLSRYPYCYGYWKKWVDMERRSGFINKAEEVCLRGLQLFPLSLDLWIHYLSFLQETLNMNLPQSAPRIRAAFRSAVAAAGWDFRSDRLWEMYADWERDQGDPRAAIAVYDRVLSVPTQLYNQHFHRFKELVSSHTPREILSAAEFLELRSEVMQGCAAVTPDPDGGSAEGPPGEEGPPGLTAGDQETDEHEQKIRELLVARRQEVYESNEVEVSKRWSFEEAIKRPYFHVKPLDRAQLRNWHSYLDFEMEAESGAESEAESGAGSGGRAGLLFERCLVACALYEEFWSKYAKFQAQRSVDGARSVFKRACEIHLPRKPSMHLLWAAFEEQQGNLEEARRVLEALDQSVPGLAMVRLRRASLERRAGNLEGAESLLREAVLQSQATPIRSFYSIKLARQLLRVQRDHGKARRVLQDAIDRDPTDSKLHLALLELELSAGEPGQSEGPVLQCLSHALSCSLPPQTRLLLSRRRLEFQEDFGSSVQSLLTAYDEHQNLLNETASLKRRLENGDCEEEEEDDEGEEPAEKKVKSENSPVATPPDHTPVAMPTPPAPLMGGDFNNGQAAYNYGAWYQQQYGGYGYQSPWNYNQYYPPS
ncbi:pre-mRNA-processing factor 39 [Acipenser ruthenus]|uniref:pre-mRNA-processing factor 39 n=1 Tax=Acipenser ruthenus TaxID=7906 RepID=UPI002740B908|nr:pre-mRNA-processing factor 39 [Acipenser ruthenus]